MKDTGTGSSVTPWSSPLQGRLGELCPAVHEQSQVHVDHATQYLEGTHNGELRAQHRDTTIFEGKIII